MKIAKNDSCHFEVYDGSKLIYSGSPQIDPDEFSDKITKLGPNPVRQDTHI